MTKFLSISIIICILISCDSTKNKLSNVFGQIQQELTDTLNKISDTTLFNGFGIVIVSDKGVLYKNGFGYANIATKEK